MRPEYLQLYGKVLKFVFGVEVIANFVDLDACWYFADFYLYAVVLQNVEAGVASQWPNKCVSAVVPGV